MSSELICAADTALIPVMFRPAIKVVDKARKLVVLMDAIWLEPNALNAALPIVSK